MPPQGGEVIASTVFADVRYFFSVPSAKPVHHRFDKGSYFYLYHDAAQNQARLEVANNAGTADQDSFSGSMDCASVAYDHNQPNLMTFTIDQASASFQQNTQSWRLPAFDPRNETKYLYPIHTIDFYFRNVSDSSTVLAALKGILPADRLQNLNEPAQVQHDVAPVTQQFAQSSISNPQQSYSGGASEGQNVSSPAPVQVGAIAPPAVQASGTASPAVQKLEEAAQVAPALATPSLAKTTAADAPTADQQAQEPSTADFTPMAYNPAAPAAPEPIAAREKTPPPAVDDATNSGMAGSTAPSYVPPQAQDPGYIPPEAQAPSYIPPQAQAPSYVPPQAQAPGYVPPQAQAQYQPMAASQQAPQPQPYVPGYSQQQSQTTPQMSSQYQPTTSPNPQQYQPTTSPNSQQYQPTASPNPQQYQPTTSPNPQQYQPTTSPNPQQYQPTTSPNPQQYQPTTSPNPQQYQPTSPPPAGAPASGSSFSKLGSRLSAAFPLSHTPQQQYQTTVDPGGAYAVHSQSYTPTAAEQAYAHVEHTGGAPGFLPGRTTYGDAAAAPAPGAYVPGQGQGQPQQQAQGGAAGSTKMGQRVGGVEGGVNRFLKRLERF